jgi:sugar phosphate isomerase/epimerase
MDVYWVAQGGADPVAYLNKYAGRFPVLHIKDAEIIGASGTMDFGPIFDAAYAQGMKDYYVEVERYGSLPPEVCVQKSFDFLEAATYVK